MNWFAETFLQPSTIQAVLILCLVSGIGTYLGKFKFKGISLGITFVFFTGIIISHFGVEVKSELLSFAQTLGLVIFVYTLGLQVGPGFFSSLKKGGIVLNMLALAVIMIGVLLVLATHWATDISLPNLVGVLSGAVTNTPALGAAQQALLQIDSENTRGVTDMALACAVTYPLGVVGVILAIIVLRKMFADNPSASKTEENDTNTFVAEFQVCNPAIYNRKIRDVMKLSGKHFVISRLWRDGKVTIPHSDTVLKQNDHLMTISVKSDVETLEVLFGEQEETDWNKADIDWNAIDSQLVSKRILVTKDNLNGVKLGSLRLRNLYEVNITRITRASISLLPSPSLRLQMGDKLTIVGEENAIKNVSKILGDEVKRLDNPNLIPIFVGVALGVLLGSVPIDVPGMELPVTLGLAGGPIIVGILVGAFGSRFHISTYTTNSANLMMRQFGIILYLASLGLASGSHFFETLFRPEGLLWIVIGFGFTLIPIITVGYVSSKIFGIKYAKNIGLLCGSMSNPMALVYANSTVDSDEPSVAYATVYPLSMFARVIAAQVLIMFS